METEPMDEPEIRFQDGAGYERMMGTWSRLAGDVFLDWLAPDAGLRWIDVGCGNGAFSDLVLQRCRPSRLDGLDPSPQQLAFARARSAGQPAHFVLGDAQALPYPDAAFDVAVMALVIFFVPEPALGVREMARVVAAGGRVAAYAWDVLGGGFPLDPLQQEMRALGITPLYPPSVQASRTEALVALWHDAGLVDVQTREITVQRTFDNFDDLWATSLLGTSVGSRVAAMTDAQRERLHAGLRQRVGAGPDGRIVCSARANAVRGRRPG
jgi:SAM-dependent methyltransferase